ncbi:hypothetical protein QJQ58_15710 [Paenibacillus dendritiformis]|uniref:hypothetical protein n=1 Tax=Paenibacillus dendritiformis TaxID=130049 RepID=UPI00248BDA9B|nr:hypothetical protein [Paenibacillus dendritiformis]WGU92058.1 hypothetical protein QJQ58_15710 [Paenibacillus dendritiformis]
MAARNKKTQICEKCNSEKNKKDFLSVRNDLHPTGLLKICTECLDSWIKEDGLDALLRFLRFVDRPFKSAMWETSKQSIGAYMRNFTLRQNAKLTYNESDIKINKISVVDKRGDPIPEELIAKWGAGYAPDEYEAFERKYNLLKNNYQEKTAMHTEALMKYCIYQVKAENALAKNDLNTGKEWSKLAKEAAEAAKINPNQFKKEDLTSGFEAFGELVRVVEGAKDIIPVLPRFKERPQDKVDLNLWCYINYVRGLMSLPEVPYMEIYKFYDERKAEYESQIEGLNDEILGDS